MADDVLINKSATVERCVARAREEYAFDSASFATNLTRQDAAIFNVQRACEAVLDMGQHIVSPRKFGSTTERPRCVRVIGTCRMDRHAVG